MEKTHGTAYGIDGSVFYIRIGIGSVGVEHDRKTFRFVLDAFGDHTAADNTFSVQQDLPVEKHESVKKINKICQNT